MLIELHQWIDPGIITLKEENSRKAVSWRRLSVRAGRSLGRELKHERRLTRHQLKEK